MTCDFEAKKIKGTFNLGVEGKVPLTVTTSQTLTLAAGSNAGCPKTVAFTGIWKVVSREATVSDELHTLCTTCSGLLNITELGGALVLPGTEVEMTWGFHVTVYGTLWGCGVGEPGHVTTNHAKNDVFTSEGHSYGGECWYNTTEIESQEEGWLEEADVNFNVGGVVTMQGVAMHLIWPAPYASCTYRGTLTGGLWLGHGLVGNVSGTLTGTDCPEPKVTVQTGYGGIIATHIAPLFFEWLYNEVV